MEYLILSQILNNFNLDILSNQSSVERVIWESLVKVWFHCQRWTVEFVCEMFVVMYAKAAVHRFSTETFRNFLKLLNYSTTFTGTPAIESLFSKAAGLEPTTLLTKRLRRSYFLVNFSNCFITFLWRPLYVTIHLSHGFLNDKVVCFSSVNEWKVIL